MSDAIYRTQLRLPTDTYERLKGESEMAGRSLNAEIAFRLEMSLLSQAPATVAKQPTERQKAELLLEFEAWTRSVGTLSGEIEAYREFCRVYNGADPDSDLVEPVYGIEEVRPRFLRDLALAWRRYARESAHVHQFTDPTRSQRLVPERRKRHLIMSYLRWCNVPEMNPLDPASLVGFCEYYSSAEDNQVLDVPAISPSYLEELVNEWVYELPAQLAVHPEGQNFLFVALQAMQKQQQDRLKAIEVAMSRFGAAK
ncbi:TraY domain-containing protein [Vogesella sp. DC21W]|uniref:TraY domain-containing protein n=1 Tax=Vogesella aquatica TaxID=2984206 RepID=A0ABT5IVL2_9NEIS|nr:Arc family DNA-binding protein [Vogesella aquatica]MDC7716607.1 TraY domain-containing protein [Vogesella aquatica]